jgi:DNA-3-methyladenine glycosylase I
MPPVSRVTPPKDDADYFERMSRALFTAGLNWAMIEKKWPNFRKAFAAFSPEKVAKMTEKDVKALMGDTGIVRNERKIRATIHNAGEFASLKKEFGSFKGYLLRSGRTR